MLTISKYPKWMIFVKVHKLGRWTTRNSWIKLWDRNKIQSPRRIFQDLSLICLKFLCQSQQVWWENYHKDSYRIKLRIYFRLNRQTTLFQACWFRNLSKFKQLQTKLKKHQSLTKDSQSIQIRIQILLINLCLQKKFWSSKKANSKNFWKTIFIMLLRF